jgi:uncharacterized protein (TIGR00725 family)
VSKQRPERLSQQRLVLAVVGAGTCNRRLGNLAYEVGQEIARQGAVLLCGGRGGVMERAAAGAREAGGTTVGILPGRSSYDSPPNESIDLPIFTGLGQARNQVLILSAHAVISVGGGWGTLTEIGLAMKHVIPVVLLESWRLSHPTEHLESLLDTAESAIQAVAMAVAAAKRAGSSRSLEHSTADTNQESSA